MTRQWQESNCQQALRVAARAAVPVTSDQAVMCGGERSRTGTPPSRLTRNFVVKAVPEKYS